MLNCKFWGTIQYGVENAAIDLDDKLKFYGWLREKFKNGQRVEIIVRQESDKISHDLYEFLYGAIYTPLSEETGYTVRQLDDLFKDLYVQEKGIYLPKDREISKSLDFDKKEMLKYIEFIQDYAASWWGFTVVPVNENWKG